jgi:hypothetical protein
MAILEVFSQFYAKAEDRYFSALDWLDAKGIPVYAYSNALEAHGIPLVHTEFRELELRISGNGGAPW